MLGIFSLNNLDVALHTVVVCTTTVYTAAIPGTYVCTSCWILRLNAAGLMLRRCPLGIFGIIMSVRYLHYNNSCYSSSTAGEIFAYNGEDSASRLRFTDSVADQLDIFEAALTS